VPLRDLLSAQGGTKDANRIKILRAIMAKPGSQAFLASRASLAASTVSAAVADLEARGYVVRDSVKNISLPVTTGAAVGVELGYHYTAVVARRADQSTHQAKTVTVSAGAAHGTHRWLPDVAEAVREAVSELGEDDIVTIGLGVPRIIDPQSGKLLGPMLPPWIYGDDPAQVLSEELRKRGPLHLSAPRVIVDNDANLAALAESIYSYDDAETLVAIKASTGIGAGIVIGGNIFRGARGVAGEIGHVVVEPGGRFCPCGGRGCLETVIGADALLEQARTTIAGRRNNPVSLAELLGMARDGHPACQRVLREAATTLGVAIGNLCNILNPDVVVLGGALGRRDAADYTLAPCREALSRSGLRAAVADTGGRNALRVEASTMDHAAAHGALVIGLQGTVY
jgi:predicted NBD/HSP70 family sugar kinase